jgi:uncharacterized NAD(P)/FAD-binding protein YdhS
MTAVIVIGGGFTGAAVAIALSRRAQTPLDIAVIEPRVEVGRGVAYSATDRDHRINAPAANHCLTADDAEGFDRWLRQTGRVERDPEMAAADGSLFPRRSELGAYACLTFDQHTARNPSGSRLRHIRSRAMSLAQNGEQFHVRLENGETLIGDLAVITTSNEGPRPPAPFATDLSSDPRFLVDPWDTVRLKEIKRDGRVMLLGAGLTAADVAASILRERPHARVDVISRTGIRPTSRPAVTEPMTQTLWERLDSRPSLFEKLHGRHETVLGILRALRKDIATRTEKGMPWQPAFDDLRESARMVWMGLPFAERRRFQRHLRRQYDACRFRYPPQTKAILDSAEQSGRLRFHAGSVTAAEATPSGIHVTWRDRVSREIQSVAIDQVINCIGLASRPDASDNPLLRAALHDGFCRVAPLGIGLDVDEACRAIGADGRATRCLFVVGPLSFATFGYCLGVPFIIDQIARALPEMFEALP